MLCYRLLDNKLPEKESKIMPTEKSAKIHI